jgi:hypothetical protein
MHVSAGDLLVIKAQHTGEPDVHMEVLETHGADGAPPWRVRWGTEGHEALLFPGPEATIEHVKGGGHDLSSPCR